MSTKQTLTMASNANDYRYLALLNTSWRRGLQSQKQCCRGLSRHAGARQSWWTHLYQDTIKPLQWSIEMNLNPARCTCYRLPPNNKQMMRCIIDECKVSANSLISEPALHGTNKTRFCSNTRQQCSQQSLLNDDRTELTYSQERHLPKGLHRLKEVSSALCYDLRFINSTYPVAELTHFFAFCCVMS